METYGTRPAGVHAEDSHPKGGPAAGNWLGREFRDAAALSKNRLGGWCFS